MPSSTAKYVIPYAQLADTIASLAQTTQDLASRVDLLLGESGSITIAATANVAFSQAVVLSRTYPGNTGGSPPGYVAITPVTAFGSGATVFFWVDTWTGSATTITGFTIRGISSTTTNRTFLWRFIPAL